MDNSEGELLKTKILVLSWSVPPAATGSGIVMQNLLQQFSQNEMVVVGAYYIGHPQSTWKRFWPHIVYGMLNPPEYWRGQRWWRIIQSPILLIVSLRTMLVNRCQIILAVYPDDIFLLNAYLLARLFCKPLFVYFHNTYLENSPHNILAKWLQPRVLNYAKHIFVMSEGVKRFYQKQYPEKKFSSLTHIVPKLPDIDQIDEIPLHSPIRLVFIGNVNGSCEDAARRFALLVNDNPGIELRIYSGMSPRSFYQKGFTGKNVTIETVPYDQLLVKIGDADIVIHPHGFHGPMANHEYQTIFPTKTIEYLLCRRPILAHLPDDCFLAEFYRQYDCALIVNEPTLDSLKQGLNTLALDKALRRRLVMNALKAARQFYAPRVADELRKNIKNSLGSF